MLKPWTQEGYSKAIIRQINLHFLSLRNVGWCPSKMPFKLQLTQKWQTKPVLFRAGVKEVRNLKKKKKKKCSTNTCQGYFLKGSPLFFHSCAQTKNDTKTLLVQQSHSDVKTVTFCVNTNSYTQHILRHTLRKGRKLQRQQGFTVITINQRINQLEGCDGLVHIDHLEECRFREAALYLSELAILGRQKWEWDFCSLTCLSLKEQQVYRGSDGLKVKTYNSWHTVTAICGFWTIQCTIKKPKVNWVLWGHHVLIKNIS